MKLIAGTMVGGGLVLFVLALQKLSADAVAMALGLGLGPYCGHPVRVIPSDNDLLSADQNQEGE